MAVLVTWLESAAKSSAALPCSQMYPKVKRLSTNNLLFFIFLESQSPPQRQTKGSSVGQKEEPKFGDIFGEFTNGGF